MVKHADKFPFTRKVQISWLNAVFPKLFVIVVLWTLVFLST